MSPAPADDRADYIAQQFQALLARRQFENFIASEVERLLRDAFAEIATRLLTTPDLSLAQRARLQGMLDGFATKLRAQYIAAEGAATQNFAALMLAEQEAAQEHFIAFTGADSTVAAGFTFTPTRELVAAIAQLQVEGLPFGEWWQNQWTRMASLTRRQIQLGLVQGESVSKIAARIMPPRGSTEPALWSTAQREARALVRTSYTAVQSEAALRTYQSFGQDVVAWVQFSAVLDHRTTPICRATDGKRWRVDDPALRRPPLHINCRSTLIPEPNWKALGVRESDLPPELTIRTYASWLGDQSTATQNRLLGPARAQLWRDGTVTLGDLVDSEGREIPLATLRRRLGLDATPAHT